MAISVLLVDDHPMFRKGLRMMLSEEEDIEVVGEAGDGEEAIQLASKLAPDVVVMDITMPNVDGIDATRKITSKCPGVKVIPLSIHSGKRFVENMLRAGAAGYILKESAPEDMVHAIRAVQRGDVYLSSAISGVVVSEYVRLLNHPEDRDDRGELNESEAAVLRMVAEGHSVKEMAEALGSNTSAVQATRRRMMKKLGVVNVAELTEYSRAKRWVEGTTRVELTASRDVREVARSTSILGTKFHRPVVAADFLTRQRLFDKLDHGRRLPMILVSAGAGYGKSTLVSDWLVKNDQQHVAWLSLSEDDSALGAFLRYFVAAVEGLIPDACPETTSLLQAAQMPTGNVLVNALGNDLDAIDESFILVLDDYHLIANAEVHALLECLLRHPPRALQLVLITRHDPPFSLAALRARGSMTEIRQDDLCFTRPEVRAVFKQMTGVSVSDVALAHLEEKLEGWIVGLRLFGLLLQGRSDPEAAIYGLKGCFQQVEDYLMEEVFSQQPAALRDFLVQTSVLNRFCGSLVEAVCSGGGDSSSTRMTGDDFIQTAELANLFIVRLNPLDRWYRYHHLFRELLLRQLERQQSPTETSALHARASKWFELEGLMDDAIRHALAAGDSERAAFPDDQSGAEPKASEVEPTLLVVQAQTGSRPTAPQEVMEASKYALTNRERETLELLAQRLYDKEIAKAMSISVWTVKSHVKHIYEKLKVSNRRQAIHRAEELGLVKRK